MNLADLPPEVVTAIQKFEVLLEGVLPEDKRQLWLHLVDGERAGSPELARLVAAREELLRAASFHEVLSRLPRTREAVTAHKRAADEVDHACSRYGIALSAYRDIGKAETVEPILGREVLPVKETP